MSMCHRKIVAIEWMHVNESEPYKCVCEFTCEHVRIGSLKISFWTDVEGSQNEASI